MKSADNIILVFDIFYKHSLHIKWLNKWRTVSIAHILFQVIFYIKDEAIFYNRILQQLLSLTAI